MERFGGDSYAGALEVALEERCGRIFGFETLMK